jgi:hypothetical protein
LPACTEPASRGRGPRPWHRRRAARSSRCSASAGTSHSSSAA